MITLPRELDAYLAARLAAADWRRVSRAATALSQRYREDAAATGLTPDDVLAYAAWMLPATHAQVLGALRMAPLRAGTWSPSTLLDLGGGPGTAAWAALDVWPSLDSVTIVDRERAFLSLGRDAAAHASSAALREATWLEGQLPGGVPNRSFDLVVLAHVIGELGERDASLVLRRAWQACGGVLVVVEPGTPAGFLRMEAARRLAIELGAFVLAPCPHRDACPLAAKAAIDPPQDWCHFSERHERPAFQRRVKEASLPWEDAGFSHVVLARFEPTASPWARVLRHPWHAKGRVDLQLCSRDGLLTRHVGRAIAAQWKLARRLEWGSAIEQPDDIGLS